MSSNGLSIFLKDSQSGGMPSLTSNLYAFGEFCVDPQSRVLRLRDEPIALTPKAFEVLVLLIQANGQVVSKNELMKAVWPDSFVEESNLTQTVFMLRKALGETAEQRYILTVQGQGYRFVMPVLEAELPRARTPEAPRESVSTRTALEDASRKSGGADVLARASSDK